MTDDDHDLRTRFRELEEAFLQQAAGVVELATNTNKLAEQLAAVFAVNTALVAVMRDQNQLDVDQIQARVLAALSSEQLGGTVGLYVNALLGKLVLDEPLAPPKPTAEELRERARARFTVVEGGGQGDGGTE